MPAIDLHVHTTISDGALTPEEVVALSLHLELGVVAITDHDAVEGAPRALAAAKGTPLTVIPGVELSTHDEQHELHILGYWLDDADAAWRDKLAEFRQQRLTRAEGMVEKLNALGLSLDWERVLGLAGPGVVGRPHVARAMQEAGYVSSIQEAFDSYLGREGPAYVARYKMTPGEAIELIHHAGGVSVLAHPWGALSTLPELVREGLQGLEVYYHSYTPEVTAVLRQAADEYSLACTGGSDFHGLGDASEGQLGSVDVPPSCLEQLTSRRTRR